MSLQCYIIIVYFLFTSHRDLGHLCDAYGVHCQLEHYLNVKYTIQVKSAETNFNEEAIFRIGECLSNSPFLKIMEPPKWPRPIVFKEWRDTMTFSNLKFTHCTLLIINLVTNTICVQYLKYKVNNNSISVHIFHNSPFFENNGEFRQQTYIRGGF